MNKIGVSVKLQTLLYKATRGIHDIFPVDPSQRLCIKCPLKLLVLNFPKVGVKQIDLFGQSLKVHV